MNQSLHILNGDATWHKFKDTGITGEVVIWREVLSEGPLVDDIDSREFWIVRSQWIGCIFKSTPEEYQFKVINEIEPLKQHVHFNEITLWFEFDLHCQVNLLGVLQLLKGIDLLSTKLYLICPSSFPGIENFAGIGQLTAEQLLSLYPQRLRLTHHDMEIANQAWTIYVRQDAQGLESWLSHSADFGNLLNLKPALQAHLKRLQVDKEGLNYIHNKLLSLYNNGYKTKTDIYNAFWETEKIFGMGDAEIDTYLRQLVAKQLLPLLVLN